MALFLQPCTELDHLALHAVGAFLSLVTLRDDVVQFATKLVCEMLVVGQTLFGDNARKAACSSGLITSYGGLTRRAYASASV